jgi:hypothetical protein
MTRRINSIVYEQRRFTTASGGITSYAGMSLLDDFDNYPDTPNFQGDYENTVTMPALSATMTISVLIYVAAVPTVYNQQTIMVLGANGSGQFSVNAFGAVIFGRVVTNIPAAYDSGYLVVAGDVGKYLLMTYTFDGVNITGYRQGVVQVATPTAGAVLPNTVGTSLGGAYGGSCCYELGVAGMAFSNTTVIAAPLTHYNNVVTAGDMVGFTGATHLWKTSYMNFTELSWRDSISGLILGKNAASALAPKYSHATLVMA